MSALDVVIDMCASLAAFRTLIGAADAAAAKALCIAEDSGDLDALGGTGVNYAGDALSLVPPLWCVGEESVDPQALGAMNAVAYFGTVTVDVIVTRPVAATLATSDTTWPRWARAQQTAIRDALMGLRGTAGALARYTITCPRPLVSDQGAWRDAVLIPLTIDWE